MYRSAMWRCCNTQFSIAIAIYSYTMAIFTEALDPSPRLNLDLPRSPRVIAYCLYCCFARASVSDWPLISHDSDWIWSCWICNWHVNLNWPLACWWWNLNGVLLKQQIRLMVRFSWETNYFFFFFFSPVYQTRVRARNPSVLRREWVSWTMDGAGEDIWPWIQAFVDRRRGFTATRIIINDWYIYRSKYTLP